VVPIIHHSIRRASSALPICPSITHPITHWPIQAALSTQQTHLPVTVSEKSANVQPTHYGVSLKLKSTQFVDTLSFFSIHI